MALKDDRPVGGAQACGFAALWKDPKVNRKDAKNAKVREEAEP
jgi:hypothetical protein